MTLILKTILLHILLVATVIASVGGLRCYECTNVNVIGGGICSGSDFNLEEMTIVTCNGTDVCVKSVFGGIVSRSCGEMIGSNADACFDLFGIEGCTCSTDLCNSSQTLRFNTAVYFVVLFLAFLKKLY